MQHLLVTECYENVAVLSSTRQVFGCSGIVSLECLILPCGVAVCLLSADKHIFVSILLAASLAISLLNHWLLVLTPFQ